MVTDDIPTYARPGALINPKVRMHGSTLHLWSEIDGYVAVGSLTYHEVGIVVCSHKEHSAERRLPYDDDARWWIYVLTPRGELGWMLRGEECNIITK